MLCFPAFADELADELADEKPVWCKLEAAALERSAGVSSEGDDASDGTPGVARAVGVRGAPLFTEGAPMPMPLASAKAQPRDVATAAAVDRASMLGSSPRPAPRSASSGER